MILSLSFPLSLKIKSFLKKLKVEDTNMSNRKEIAPLTSFPLLIYLFIAKSEVLQLYLFLQVNKIILLIHKYLQSEATLPSSPLSM